MPDTSVPDLFPELPERLTLKDIEQAHIRSRAQLDRDIAAGRLRAYKLGGRVFVTKADLLAMVRPVRAAR